MKLPIFRYEISEGVIDENGLELEYKKWDDLNNRDTTVDCSDYDILTGSLLNTVTWDLRADEVLATVDGDKHTNITECDGEVGEYTWDRTIETAGIDAVIVMLYDNWGDVVLNEWVLAEYRLLPNGIYR